jgi:AraC family L-rhamnose operon regulatory protein RhaS
MTQILFHPEFVNSRFDFSNLDPAARTLPRSAELDKFYMLPFIDRGSGYRGWFLPDPEQDESLRKKIKKLVSDYADRKSPFRPCRQRSSFLDLLLFLCRNYRGKDGVQAEDSLVEKVISFFTENYQDRITIPDLCSRFGTNRNTLAKKFREERGVPVMGALSEIRIRMASSLLVKTHLPVADILYRVGFNDTAHFGRAFKKVMGVSPSEYRKSAERDG